MLFWLCVGVHALLVSTRDKNVDIDCLCCVIICCDVVVYWKVEERGEEERKRNKSIQTRAKPQQIVAQRPLSCLQSPVAKSSHLQAICLFRYSNLSFSRSASRPMSRERRGIAAILRSWVATLEGEATY